MLFLTFQHDQYMEANSVCALISQSGAGQYPDGSLHLKYESLRL